MCACLIAWARDALTAEAAESREWLLSQWNTCEWEWHKSNAGMRRQRHEAIRGTTKRAPTRESCKQIPLGRLRRLVSANMSCGNNKRSQESRRGSKDNPAVPCVVLCTVLFSSLFVCAVPTWGIRCTHAAGATITSTDKERGELPAGRCKCGWQCVRVSLPRAPSSYDARPTFPADGVEVVGREALVAGTV